MLCTRPKFQDQDQDQDQVVQDQDRDQDRKVQDQDRDQDLVVEDRDQDRVVQDRVAQDQDIEFQNRLKLKISSANEQLLRPSLVVIQQLPLFQLQR